MEEVLEAGKVKSIGMSNFSIKTLFALLLEYQIVPIMNQVEIHPCWSQEGLRAFCEAKEILLTSYFPLRTYVFFSFLVSMAVGPRDWNRHYVDQ
jgi:glycerol 2-dehydrogenase (NADP+)